MGFCSKCLNSHGTLIEVYDPTCNTNDNVVIRGTPPPLRLCQLCVVGHTLPVVRLKTSNWEMAEVKSFEDGRHIVEYVDEEHESVVIDLNPFSTYLSQFRLAESDVSIDAYLLGMPDEEASLSLDSFSLDIDDSDPVDWALDKAFNTSFNWPINENDGDASSEASSPTHTSEDSIIDEGRKRMSHLWSPDEDQTLICVVQSQAAAGAIKWSNVATFIKGRTGKQCRERYVNHLKPQVKNDSWSPVEDAQLFSLFKRRGSKWALMTKLLRGRSDNSIKNRFHHIRRRLEKDLQRATKTQVTVDQSNFVVKAREMIPFVARMEEPHDKAGFGPFQANIAVCSRCSLMVPSAQTGRLICQSTNWCQSCTKMPPYLCDASLRDALSSLVA